MATANPFVVLANEGEDSISTMLQSRHLKGAKVQEDGSERKTTECETLPENGSTDHEHMPGNGYTEQEKKEHQRKKQSQKKKQSESRSCSQEGQGQLGVCRRSP